MIFLALILYNPRKKVSAHTGGSKYDLTICDIEFPDGSHHRAAMCWAPSTNGPCDRATECMNGVPPPQEQ